MNSPSAHHSSKGEVTPLELFQEVYEDLIEKSTVGWQNAVSSLEFALEYYETKEAQIFMDNCLHRIMGIMLDQHPSKIGTFEKNCVIRTLHCCVPILTQQLTEGNLSYLPLLCMLFNKKRTLYKDVRSSNASSSAVAMGSYWNKMNGAPEVRTQCVEKFIQQKGFKFLHRRLLQIYREQKEEVMLTCDDAKIIIQTIADFYGSIPNEDMLAISIMILRYVSELSSSELKKESVEVVGSIVHQVKRLIDCGAVDVESTFELWLNLTKKYVHSTSLPQRLFGFEQIVGLIQLVQQSRPFPTSFLVKNAGTELVNGEYQLCAESGVNAMKGNCSMYTKELKNGQTLTLFRCTMRSGSKWWFISEADKDQPGTDKDIDYYQNQTQREDDAIPPTDDWTSTNQSIAPAPTLSPIYSSPKTSATKISSEDQFIKWVEDCGVFSHIFGDGIHRELVSRSKVLLTYLAKASALTTQHIDIIWTSLFEKEETLQDELNLLLVEVVPYLEDDLVLHLLDSAYASLKKGQYADVLEFAEKLSDANLGNCHLLLEKNSEITHHILKLLWALQDHPQDSTTSIGSSSSANGTSLNGLPNGSVNSHISENVISFFRETLRSPHGNQQRQVFFNECLDDLKESCNSLNQTRELENATTRSIHLLQFMIDAHTNQIETIEQLSKEHHFTALLFQELEVFSDSYRHADVENSITLNKSSFEYQAAIQCRLDLIRYANGKSKNVDLSEEDVNNLWNILDDAEERELLFIFLGKAGVSSEGLEAAFNVDVCHYILEELLCKQTDFATLGQAGYQCFHTYFTGLNVRKKSTINKPGSDFCFVSLDLLGLDALWKIAFDARCQDVANKAIYELLSVYGSLESPNQDMGTRDFFQRTFQRLALVQHDEASAYAVIQHCIHLLNGYVVHPAHGSVMSCPHGLRGQGYPFQVNIRGQRLQQTSQSGSGAAKLEAFPLRVHSKMFLSVLRQRISNELRHPIDQIKILAKGTALSDDMKTLQQLGISNDMDLRVLLFGHPVKIALASSSHFAENVTNESSLKKHPGDILAESMSYFDILFHLLDFITDREACHSLLDVIDNIPSNEQLLERVLTLEEDSSASGMDLKLNDPRASYNRSVYIMQLIDAVLKPSDGNSRQNSQSFDQTEWMKHFIASDGFSQVLTFLMNDHQNSFSTGFPVALRIVQFFLFEESSGLISTTRALQTVNFSSLMTKLISFVAATSAQQNDTASSSCNVILDALHTIQAIILHLKTEEKSSSLEFQLVKDVVVPLLISNESDIVRSEWFVTLKLICNVSEETKVIVFDQLIQCLSSAAPSMTATPSSSSSSTSLRNSNFEDESFSSASGLPLYDQLFQLLEELIQQQKNTTLDIKFVELTNTILKNLRSDCPKRSLSSISKAEESKDVIIGSLKVLKEAVLHSHYVRDTCSAEILVTVYDECLFAMPGTTRRQWSLCSTVETRKPALELLSTVAQASEINLMQLITRCSQFLAKSSPVLENQWEYEFNIDLFRSRGDHVGLKNQGCTCYMNAFLQQIFMEVPLRQGLLHAQLPPREDNLLSDQWTLDTVREFPEKLVGFRVANQCYNGKCFEANVLDYDATQQKWTIRYDEGEDAYLNLFDGRPGKENGQFQILPPELSGEDATLEVLREVQRTFYYLKDSKMRYFDPRSLVDISKTLNLEFSVYQQNDASEYCDKLIDRLEMGLKKTPQGTACLQQSLGGTLVSQKLPKKCGHRFDREEPFIRIELQIRGKSSIEESLGSFVEGELMDGDNKVECELCNTKKAAIRRTCFGILPNFLILHLKRFDLDYTTFETVKLNNRCAFPLTLNMKPYTKKGIEEMEAQEDLNEDDGGASNDVDIENDDEDYEYELRGVLVHSGVAQGGHYYSFIYDRESESWSKFDDDDVSPFDPANIELECFGGVQTRTTSWNGVNNTTEMEMYSNALMLFYSKKERTAVTSTTTSETTAIQSGELLCNSGSGTFEIEVRQQNENFVQNSYLLDCDFHEFLRDIVDQGTQGLLMTAPSNTTENRTEDKMDNEELQFLLAQLGTKFVLSVLVHLREKNFISNWFDTLFKRFSDSRQACEWFIRNISEEWYESMFFHCTDVQARRSFIHIVSMVMESWNHFISEEIEKQQEQQKQIILAPLIQNITDFVFSCTPYDLHHPAGSEYFQLIKACTSKCESFRLQLCSKDIIAYCIYLLLGDDTPEELHEALTSMKHQAASVSPKSSPSNTKLSISTASNAHLLAQRRQQQYSPPPNHRRHHSASPTNSHVSGQEILQLVDVIPSILGFPAPEPVAVLQLVAYPATSEAPSSPQYQQQKQQQKLSLPAEKALRTVFREHCDPVTHKMTIDHMQQYYRACGTTIETAKGTKEKILRVFCEYASSEGSTGSSSSLLSLDQFLQFYQDSAVQSTKHVTNDLMALGFGIDLQRQASCLEYPPASRVLAVLPEASRLAIQSTAFFDLCLEEYTDQSTDMVFRVSCGNMDTSTLVLQRLLRSLESIEGGWKGNHRMECCVNLMTKIITYHQESSSSILLHHVFQASPYGLLCQLKERIEVHNASKDKLPPPPPSYPVHQSQPQPVLIYRLIHMLLELYQSTSVCREYLDQCTSDWKFLYPWLYSATFLPCLGGREATRSRDPTKFQLLKFLGSIFNIETFAETLSYVVEGAGTSGVNGHYVRRGDFDACPKYVHDVFTLFRCSLPSHNRRWYISITPPSGTLGTAEDEDYYYQDARAGADMTESPPLEGWKRWSKNSQSIGPPPTLRVVFSKQQENVSESDEKSGDEDHDSEVEIRNSNKRMDAIHLGSIATDMNIPPRTSSFMHSNDRHHDNQESDDSDLGEEDALYH